MDGVVVNVKPEYEDCKDAAMALGVPLRAVVDEAKRVATTGGHVDGPPPQPSLSVEEEEETEEEKKDGAAAGGGGGEGKKG